MTNASRAKRKRAAVRSAKRSRQNTWWYGLTAIVVIAGIGLIVYARATTPSPVGPYLQDGTGTKQDTHWHAALGVYDCDHWMGDSPGTGVWNWPLATPSGGPARADNPSVYAGMHSHNDGVIHMEPVVTAEAGKNTTVGLYFDFGGWKISPSGFTFLGTKRENGDKCGDKPGTLQWATGKWDGDTTGKNKQKYTVQTGNPADFKLNQGDIVLLAFLPEGKSILSIGNPPAVPNLAKALDVENVQPGATMPTVPTPGATTASTVPGAATPTTAAATPTTSTATPTSTP